MPLVVAGTIEREEFLFNPVALARLHAQHKLAVHEPLPSLVQQQGVDGVSQRIAHACGHKDVFVTVRVEIRNADAPRPIRLRADLGGDLDELALTLVLIERVSENVVGRALKGGG